MDTRNIVDVLLARWKVRRDNITQNIVGINPSSKQLAIDLAMLQGRFAELEEIIGQLERELKSSQEQPKS